MQTANWQRIGATCVLLSGLAAMVTLVGGTQAHADDDLSPQNVDNLYNRYWQPMAKQYIAYAGDFVAFPAYSSGADSSSNIDAREWAKQNTRQSVYYDKQERRQTRTVLKVREELDAVTRTIPDFMPGSFGSIHSGRVVSADRERIVLRDVWLVDADALRDAKLDDEDEARRKAMADMDRIRHFRDFNHIQEERLDRIAEVDWQYEEREKLAQRQNRDGDMVLIIDILRSTPPRPGQRWPGSGQAAPAIAITRVEGRRVYAVLFTSLRSGLKQAEFDQMLEKRGLDKQAFAALVLEVRRDNSRNYVSGVIERLEDRYRHEFDPQPEIDEGHASPRDNRPRPDHPRHERRSRWGD